LILCASDTIRTQTFYPTVRRDFRPHDLEAGLVISTMIPSTVVKIDTTLIAIVMALTYLAFV
jgi:hypothetical protein